MNAKRKAGSVQLLLLTLCVIATAPAFADEIYKFGPDSERKPDVPKGTVTKHKFVSKTFDNNERDYYLYVPAEYDGKTPACVMVFQDGHAYVKEDGEFRTTIVFDNLIASKEMPLTIGIFIDPGHEPEKGAVDSPWKSSNRSVEYDTLSDRYSKFIIDEMLPEISKEYKLTDDPDGRAICGISSGGICAFTVAWERPDMFRKVMSHVGSFTNIRGGHNYSPMVRKTKSAPKPIKVFLQDGKNDIDNEFGNWFLANQEMAAALKFAKYDYTFVAGDEGHNGKHGGAILPDSLRWLWKGFTPKTGP